MEDESPNQINLDPESSESSDEDSLPRCHVCLEKRGGGIMLFCTRTMHTQDFARVVHILCTKTNMNVQFVAV